jgi:hypothetical protein
MWNWKLMHDDAQLAFFCDIDNIMNPEADEDGMYASVECCQGIPARAACMASLHMKKKEVVSRYIQQRQVLGLVTEGYDLYAYTLCVVELDAETRKYRVTPAMDCDGAGAYLGVSSFFDNDEPPVKGIATEWSPIMSPKTHKAIKAVYKFIYPAPVR